ncbi:MAG: hydroxyacid dehydrogenase [Armatimonadetes bacterium]|nr:hydroxyacid dehydrogenase [Armatimonadota bacterium]
MKILVADKLHAAAMDGFRSLPGAEVVYEPSLGPSDLKASIPGVEVLVVRSTKVTAETIDHADRLGLIIRAGAGVNTIDVETASRRGIYVANCPGKNASAVAELAVGLLLAVDRRLADNVIDFRNGRWNKGEYSKADGVKGKRVGIVGAGMIGQETARRLLPFGVEIHAWSRSLTPDKAEALGYGYCATLEELARKCEVVSVHLALTKETRGLLGKSFFEALPERAIFINTSRAEVVDTAALLEAMEKRSLRVGTDVVENEPSGKQGDFDSSLGRHSRCYATHHIGASTDQAELETGLEAARIAEYFSKGAPVPNCVNLRTAPSDGYSLVVRHEDRVGVLAEVFNCLKEAGINVQEMENLVFAGARAACARILVDNPPPESTLKAVKACDGVLHVRFTGPVPVEA